MDDVLRKKCDACKHSMLSQKGHTCLSLTRTQKLELYFEDVLLKEDESDILMRLNEVASILEVSSELLEMFKQKT